MKTPHSQYWGLLIDYLKPQWPRVLLMTLLLFSSIGLQLINPLIVRHFIDTARSTKALQKLIQAGLLFIGVGLMHQAVSAISVYVSSDTWLSGRTLSDALLANYITKLHDNGKSPATIGQAVAAVKWQLKHQLQETFNFPITQATLAGIRRAGKDRGRGQVDGLIWQDVERVCVYAETGGTIAGLRDAASVSNGRTPIAHIRDSDPVWRAAFRSESSVPV